MTNEELIETVLKVLQVQKQYGKTTDPETGVQLGPRSRDELGKTQEANDIDRLETIMGNYESKFGLEIQSLQDKIAIIQKDIGTLATHLGNINTRVANLEKKTFEILPSKKGSDSDIDKEKLPVQGKKRGPYTTTKKIAKKIEQILTSAKHFTKQQILDEVARKRPDLNTLSGKSMLENIRKAKWRLDGIRRRDLKLGIYGTEGYWKKRKTKK